MPAALRVDWEMVKLVAIQIGVREAARQFSLPEDAVRQRSCREGWLKPHPKAEEATQVVQRAMDEKGLSPAVTTKAVDILTRLAERTKLRFARGLDKGAKTVSKLNGEQILDKSGKVKDLVDAASKLHGWGGDGNTTQVAVNLAFLRE